MARLFDYEERQREINKHKNPLQRLNRLINWEEFRHIIEKALFVTPKGAGGRPPYDRIMMFKILILQKYFNLSDEQTEFQIKDRISFMQFLGLKLENTVPDEKTIWLFRERLTESGLIEKLFTLFLKKLENNQIIAKEGSIVDASFVDAPKQRNSREENKAIKEGSVPDTFLKTDKNGNYSRLAQKDIDARWTCKNKEVHYGYKNHINVDVATKIIVNYSTSSASVHDSQMLKSIVDETDTKVYADSAYRSADIEQYLEENNCKSLIHEKGYKNKPLTEEQKASNKQKSKTRVRVEHIFAFMTNAMNNGLSMKYIGKKRIASSIGLLNLTYNLFRYEQLLRLKIVPPV